MSDVVESRLPQIVRPDGPAARPRPWAVSTHVVAEIPRRRTPPLRPPTFPARYDESYIALIEVQAYWIFAHWEIAQADLEAAHRALGGGELVIRVYDVTYIIFNGYNAHHFFDINVGERDGSWYINLWLPDKSLIAEIGLRSVARPGEPPRFIPIARSNCVQTPRTGQATDGEQRWLRVPGDPREAQFVPDEAAAWSDPDTPLPPLPDGLADNSPHALPPELLMQSVMRQHVVAFYNRLWARCAST